MTTLDNRRITALIERVQRDHPGEAEVEARALLELHPAAGILWKVLGVALVRQGKEALPALRQAALLLPRDAEAHANLGSALHARGSWQEALDSLRRALSLRSNDVRALTEAADALRALGSPAEAVTVYQQALRLDPRQPQTLNGLGIALMQLGHPREAAVAYRHLLSMRPQDAAVHFNLANALRQAGNFAEAIESSRRALELDRTLALAHNNLGLALQGLGRREEAIARFREGLVLEPASADLWDNLGKALVESGKAEDAAECHRRAIQLDPNRAASHLSLGLALLQYRPAQEAAVHFQRTLALQPNSSAGLCAMAQAQRLMRQPTLAEAGCRAALAQDPHDAEALCLLGELHADRGQFDAAQALFKRAIETDPACVPAYFSAAVHCKMGRDQHAWRNGVQRLLDTPLSLDREMTLRFALGKYQDDVGEYEQAFDEYRRANDLAKRHGFAYEADKLERHIDAILGCLPAAADLEPDDGASASTLPVLVIGLPRSGTSLIEQILASHPQVYGAGEVRFWNGAFNLYEQTDDATRSGAGRQMVREYLARLTEQSGTAVRVIDKMPANFLYAGLFHRLFPNAKVIHIHRHPIDNCLSIYFQRFYAVAAYANDLDDLVHYHRQYTRIMDHWRRLLPSSSLLEVSYEDLVGDQEAWTRRMLDFVGLPWDPKCLDFHETNRVVLTSSKWQVRQKMHSGSAGRWRHYDKFMGPLRALLPVVGD